MNDDAEMEDVRRLRKPLWIGAGVIIFLGYIVWPILMLPARDWGFVTDTTPCATLANIYCLSLTLMIKVSVSWALLCGLKKSLGRAL